MIGFDHQDDRLPNTRMIVFGSFPLRNLGYSRHFKLLKDLKIPFPPLNIQNEIVKEIESYEDKIKDFNKSIEITTNKIEHRINRIWGE